MEGETEGAEPVVVSESPAGQVGGGVGGVAGEGVSAVWRPLPSPAERIALAAVGTGALLSAAGTFYAIGRPIALDSFLGALVALGGMVVLVLGGLVATAARSLRYVLSPQELTIQWLGSREVIPLGRIEGIYGGRRLGKRCQVHGLHWWGHYVGASRAEGLGRLRFYGSSLEPEAAVIIATADAGYAITPDDPDGFRERLIARLEDMPPEEVETAPPPRRRAPWWMGLSMAADGATMLCLLLAVTVLLASFGYVAARFPTLPELMPLHFNYAGEPDLIGPPRDAFRMPAIGLVILLANTGVLAVVHRRQRAMGRLLAAATVFVQVVMLVAVLRVVH